MNVLIVHAHHEPTSFSSALCRTAASALRTAGHDVRISDLHAMGFDPVSDRRNFRTVLNPDRLDQQLEERHASRSDGFVPELEAEMEKLLWCDVLIFSFPIWWLGMPALLKGWVDRVFALGVAYGGGRYFSSGVLRPRRAMCIVTVGGSMKDYDGSDKYAPIGDVLYPVHRGIFEFSGLEVMEPFVSYGPGSMTAAQREADLTALRDQMLAVTARPAAS